MASAPTDGGSPGTWGAENNAWVGTTLDTATGKVKNEALQVASTAPIAAAALANKKYVDDSIKTDDVPGAVFGVGSQSTTFSNRMIIKTDESISTQDAAQTFTFDDPFPTKCVSVVTTRITAGGEFILPVSSVSTANFKIDRTSSISGNHGFYWIAIGY